MPNGNLCMVELLIKHYRKFYTHTYTQDRGKKQGTSKLRLSMNNVQRGSGEDGKRDLVVNAFLLLVKG